MDRHRHCDYRHSGHRHCEYRHSEPRRGCARAARLASVLLLALAASTHLAAQPVARVDPPHADPQEVLEKPAPQEAAPRVVAPEPPTLQEVIDGAVAWLVARQNADGSWGSHRTARPMEILASVPGSLDAFRVATTALGLLALVESETRLEGAAPAIERALEHLLEHGAVQRAGPTEHYNVWSFGYGLHALGAWLGANPEHPRAGAVRAMCVRLIEKAALYQTTDGGWGYYSFNEVKTLKPSWTSMSFTTATLLIGLERAQRAGCEVPDTVIRPAVEHLRRARLPSSAFLYGEYLQYRPQHLVNHMPGAACRTPACQVALGRFGAAVPEAERRAALEALLFEQAALQRVALRRPIPHESWYAISGYFYLYGHHYARYALEELPVADQERMWPALVRAVLACRTPSGSFWDYPLYDFHEQYGTAMALAALATAPAALRGERFAPATIP